MDFTKAFVYDGSRPLSDYDPAFTGQYSSRKQVSEVFRSGLTELRELQGRLYAQGTYGILMILQAMDAGGKDGIIKHVMSGVNPQGCQVKSFKAPAGEELSHDFMRRCIKALPQRGHIGIFNRSYYEEVLIVKVHEQLLHKQGLPALSQGKSPDEQFWENRYQDICNFEKYMSNNGFPVIKFFLNVSREEQKKRLMSRIKKTSKNWKFDLGDVEERQYWPQYRQAYEAMLKNTHTNYGPWFVIPGDKKWFARTAVCRILVDQLQQLGLQYPKAGPLHQELLEKGKKLLKNDA